MLTAGDEFGRTQGGNNNAYAQDNPITWLDWDGRDRELEAYAAAPRRAAPRPPRARRPGAAHRRGRPRRHPGRRLADPGGHAEDRRRLGGRPRPAPSPWCSAAAATAGWRCSSTAAGTRSPSTCPRAPGHHWDGAPRGRLTLGPRAVAFVAERPGDAPPSAGAAARRPLSPTGRATLSPARNPEPNRERQMDRRTLLQAALAGFLGSRLPRWSRPAAAQDARRPPPSASTPSSPAPASSPAEPFVRPLMKLTEPFADLKYDQFRAIRFRDDKRLFADGGRGFQMELMPPGFSFQDKIEINLVSGGAGAAGRLLHRLFRLPPRLLPLPRRPGARRASAATWASAASASATRQPPRRLGRGRGLPGRELLPRRRARHLLRPLGPRPRHRHRRPGPGGVPDLQRLLGARAAARRPRAAPDRRCSTATRSPAPSTSRSRPAPRR